MPATSAPLFRALILVAAGTTLAIDWPLWQTRTAPPELPLLPLPSLSVGWALLATLALAAVRPAPGLVAYALVLMYAVLADQTRIQPQFVTFGVLLGATLPGATGITLARVYLISLWLYAGLHKLLSEDFLAQTGSWMLHGLGGAAPPDWLRALFPWLVIGTEIGVALLALAPRTRRLAVAGALLLHAGILLALVNAGWNRAVWPWNVLCAAAAVFLLLPWRTTLRADLRALSWPARAAAIALLVYPLGFQVGLVDAYLGHSLYALGEPRGYVCNLGGGPQPPRPGLGDAITYNHRDGTFDCRRLYVTDALGSPLPPLHRLFVQYFARTCGADEFLLIVERRRFFTARDQGERLFYCDTPPREVLPE